MSIASISRRPAGNYGIAKPRLRSPVRKTRGADLRPEGATTLLAGECALAHYTSLAEPRRTAFAVHASAWKRLALDHVLDVVEMTDDPPFMVETWSYAPKVLTKREDRVDPLSLYLSLKLVDERMEIAAEELLEATFQ